MLKSKYVTFHFPYMVEFLAIYLAEFYPTVRASESLGCWKETVSLFLLLCVRIKHKLKTRLGPRKETGEEVG